MKLQQKDKLIMIGDSITDCGRVKPIGEGRGEALGKGYVALVDAMLGATYPSLSIRVVNMGLGGNTVRNLKERWTTDVLELKPDWLSIMIGINDVWRQFDMPTFPERHVLIEEYEQTLRELIEQTKPMLKGLVLMTPFYIEPNRNDPMRAEMDKYGRVVEKLAKEYGTLYVDTQKALDRAMEHYYPATLAWDRVHPALTGHMIIAKSFLRAIDFSWDADQ